MLKPASAKFVPQTIRRGNRCRMMILRRPIQLHAERLEDRMLMSANDPSTAIGVVISAAELHPTRIADNVVNTPESAPPVVADTKTTANQPSHIRNDSVRRKHFGLG